MGRMLVRVAGIFFVLVMSVWGVNVGEIVLYDQMKKAPDGTWTQGRIVENYQPNSPGFYARGKLSGFQEGDRIETVWIAEKAEKIPENYTIDRVKMTLPKGMDHLYASLKRGANPFPTGTYRIEILENGKTIASKRFEVQPEKGGIKNPKRCGKVTQFLFAEKSTMDEKGIIHYEGAGERFPVTQSEVSAIISLESVKPPMTYELRWFADKVGQYHNVQMLKNTAKVTLPHQVVNGEAVHEDGPWLPGIYRAELWCEGKKIAEKRFEMFADRQGKKEEKQRADSCGILSPQLLLVTEAKMDEKGSLQYQGAAERFPVSQHSLIALIAYKEARQPVTFEIRWIMEDVGDVKNKTVLTTRVDRTQAKGILSPSIELREDWPAGKYRMEIWCGGKKMGEKRFEMYIPAKSLSSALSPSPAAGAGKAPIEGRFCCTENGCGEWIRFLRDGTYEYGIMAQPSSVMYRDSYSVSGDRITVRAGTGKAGTGTVTRRDASGRPVAFTFGGSRYAKSLCPGR